MAIKLGKDFKVVNGKVVRDIAAQEARLDVSTRLKRRGSKKVRPVKRGSA